MTNPRTTGQKLTIGKLASAAGIGIETVRYYQRRGLLEEPVKPPGHHRTYSERDLTRLRFITQAKAAGFTLREIATLLTLGNDHCSVTKVLAEKKLEKITAKIADLKEVRHRLQGLIKECHTGGRKKTCGLFASLFEADQNKSEIQS